MAMQPKRYRKADSDEAKRNAHRTVPAGQPNKIGNPEVRYMRTMRAHVAAKQTFGKEAVSLVMNSPNVKILKGMGRAAAKGMRALGGPQRKLLKAAKKKGKVR